MKDRILDYLNKFATGTEDALAEELKKELKLDDTTFRQHAQAIQSAILHQYTQFSISTIDAFFQKVIRSFTREAGLMGDYRLEVEQDNILEEVIDNLIDELGSNKELTEWLVDFATENLESERAWDVRFSLIEFAKEIFKDEFRDIEEDVIRRTGDRNFFRDFRNKLWATKNNFLSQAEKLGKEALGILQAQPWTPSDIYFGKNSGLFSFFETFAFEKNLKEFKIPDRITTVFNVAENWPNKTTRYRKEIIDIARTRLIPIAQQLIDLFEKIPSRCIDRRSSVAESLRIWTCRRYLAKAQGIQRRK